MVPNIFRKHLPMPLGTYITCSLLVGNFQMLIVIVIVM